MSLQYLHYLIPPEQAQQFQPEPESVADLVQRLITIGWVDPDVATYRATVYSPSRSRATLTAGQVAADLMSLLVPGVTVVLELPLAQPSAPSDGLFSESPVGTPLGVAQCQGLEMFYCTALGMVPPDNVSGSSLPCPQCGVNLADPSLPVAGGVVPNAEILLSNCPSCNRSLEVAALVGSSPSGIDGAPKPEKAPFFKFALCLTSDSPPEDPAVSDPGLLKAVEQWAGLPFRCVSRWS